ncbi:MAG TPA: (d)CMP kinase [Lachnospiraceae bacterium]|nr:(d)CMP kinase [Lachnospiraceae bacterium]
MGYNVAIDGPAGAGKSTIAKLVAKEKGYIYVDTGALYRAMAVCFLDAGISPGEKEKIIAASEKAQVSIRYENGVQQVYAGSENVTSRLREEIVGNMASFSSAIPEVRKKLLKLQQNLAENEDVVMDGRDIGTNILPHADVKIYLTADTATRAKRRYEELVRKGLPCDYDKIEKDIEERDARDMNRETAPLRKAEDAVLIDSSHMTIEEVVSEILKYCKSNTPQQADGASNSQRSKLRGI